MASKAEICNMALSHLGVGADIASIEEASAEARACRRFWDSTLEEMLRDFNWPFTRTFLSVALVEEDPTDEWGFSYRYPSDCVRLRRILSGDRNDPRQSRVPYQLGNDTQGTLIYTDKDEAEVEYSALITDTERFPGDFTMALSFRLASYVAPRLTGGDPFKMADRSLQLYMLSTAKAKASALNEEQPDEEPEGEFIRARG